MKLSKNRLNKIRAKKNASRKKFHLRKKGSKYNKSQKKHRCNTHLKQKTLKIYVGGGKYQYGDQFIKPRCIRDMVNKISSCAVGTSNYNTLRPKLVEDLKYLEEKKKNVYKAEYNFITTAINDSNMSLRYIKIPELGTKVIQTGYDLYNIKPAFNDIASNDEKKLYYNVTITNGKINNNTPISTWPTIKKLYNWYDENNKKK